MRQTVCLLAVLSPVLAVAQTAPVIGVFDTRAAHGSGAAIDGLVRGLTEKGYHVERVSDLTPLVLAPLDILYLSDMHSPGAVDAKWREHIEAYLQAGGSVLQTWHHHILGQVSVGIRRVYGSRRMHVVPGHPAVEGVTDFDAFFGDHIVEQVGPQATVLLKNDAGDAVATAGTIGKGRVVSTGLALAIPSGNASAPPRGAELALLQGFLKWLTPTVPAAERVSALLPDPVMSVTPAHALVAAGMPAQFEVRVAGRGGAPQVKGPDGVPLTEAAATALPGAVAVRVYRAEVPTAPDRDETRPVKFAAQAGDKPLEASAELHSVYAPPAPHERRGVWLHVGMDRHPKDVMPELRRLGINMAVPRIAGGTAAFYASKVQPDLQDPLAPDGDWLAESVKYAHESGIEIHPYVNNCVVEGRTSPETLAKLRAAGRLQEDPDGRPIDWFCPSQEINFADIEKPMVEIASRYAVDGVQYDFIRYPNDRGCFCAKCRARFERETGQPVADWPADVVTGGRHTEWVEFRCRRISALVQQVSTAIRQAAPQVKISAAVFAQWPQCREQVGQDWVRWCKEGWLDFVCPMNYTLQPDLFVERTRTHRAALPPGFPLVEGIGIASGEGKMTDPGQAATH
ncbi:MAG: family 10 glycosylhydrolase, partial [Armatimonadetes bacterium]|nr:family 10 glycosylhydrolase [Armatimonadota bacterium]